MMPSYLAQARKIWMSLRLIIKSMVFAVVFTTCCEAGYHHLSLTASVDGEFKDVVVKYVEQNLSVGFGSVSRSGGAWHGYFSEHFPNTVNVSWKYGSNKELSISKKFPPAFEKYVQENNDDLFIVFVSSDDWAFGYKKDGVLTIPGEVAQSSQRREKSTQLIEFIRKGDLQAAKELLGSGADINYQIEGGQMSPLGASIQNYPQQNLEIVKFLLNRGAKVRVEMMWAARDGNLDALKLFIMYGGDVNYYQTDSGLYSPLIAAVDNGHMGIVQWLVENKADVNKPIYNNMTPIYTAALKKEYEIGKYLLDHGANANVSLEGMNWIPLDVAIKNKDERMINLLRKYKPQ